ncbi:MAG: hypothetical protein FRX49_11371 [Trebouxia sp. A1-2]|nr:MAG: hypothetical protein FRX49_11371 [Trebouxia sp. A1-2]
MATSSLSWSTSALAVRTALLSPRHTHRGSATGFSVMAEITLVNWLSFFCIFACSQPSNSTQPLRMSARMSVHVQPGAETFIVG